MTLYEIIVAGHICLDLFPRFPEGHRSSLKEMMRPGKLNYVGPLGMSTGGAVSNVGIALIKLGAKTRLMGKVGDDELGATVVRLLENYAPAEDMVRPGESTSYTVVIPPPGQDRIFLHHPGCNDTFTLADVNQEPLPAARVFHFGYPTLMKSLYDNSGRELARMLKTVKEAGLTVSLDTAMPDPDSESGKQDWETILQTALPYVDIFLPSLEECLIMIAPDEFDSYLRMDEDEQDTATPELARYVAHQFLEWGAKIVGIKCGKLGFYLRTSEDMDSTTTGRGMPLASEWVGREMWCSSYKPEKFASTTGAGDCSIAGFLRAILEGSSPEETVNCACAVGAQNVRALDATSGVGTWRETQDMVNGKWERLPVPLDDAWTPTGEPQVWLGESDRYRLE